MKRTITGIAAAATVLVTVVPAAFASTSSTVGGRKAVTVDGKVVSQPFTRVAKDAGNLTSYIGIWYLGQAVKQAGGDYSWNAGTRTFNLLVPGVDASALNIPGGVGTGDTTLQVNGVTVKKVNSFAAQDPAGGKDDITTFMPLFYLGEVFNALGSAASWNGNTFALHHFNATFTLSISGNDNEAVGQKETLSVKLTTADGKATAPAGTVTWSVDGDGSAVVDGSGHFIASAPGTYTVTASYQGQTATAKVVVYGDAAALSIRAAADSLVANGKTGNTITVNALDANGQVAASYNGTVTISAPKHGVLKSTDGTTLAVNNGVATLPLKNGTAQFILVANTGVAGDTDTLTASFTPPGGLNTVSAQTTVRYVAQVASAVELKIKDGAPSAISANTGGSTTIHVTLNDQGGEPMASGGAYVTLTLSGPGSFASSSVQTSYTTWVGASGVDVPVYGQKGVSGTITIQAASTGLTGGQLSIPTVVNTAASAITLNGVNGTDANGHGYTLYTVRLVDSNGNVVDDSTDTITLSDDAAKTGGALLYFGGSSLVNGVPSGTGSTSAPTLTLTHGIAQFAVETKKAGNGTVTLTVTDTANAFTARSAYGYQIGSAAQVQPVSTVVPSVQPGQSVTIAMQLADANGNPVKQAGQAITFQLSAGNTSVSFENGNTSTYTALTDANGVASVKVNVASNSAAGTFTVKGALNGQVSGTATVNVVSAAKFVTSLAFHSVWTNTSATAGDDFTGAPSVDLKNAIGAAAQSSDEFQIVSSNPDVVSINPAQDSGWVQDDQVAGAYDLTLHNASSFALPTMTAGKAGAATVTIRDLSNPAVPALTVNLTSVVGQATNTPAIEFLGQTVSDSNPLNVTADQPVQLTVVNVDKGGNPVPVSGTTGQAVILSDANGGSFRLSPTGASVSEVTIPAGQSSVTVYYVNGKTQTITSGLSAQYKTSN
ncbi:MAG: hypothetical protein K6T81_10360 [Alicyclobacillus macrosporangiidus]|uniref:beta strand repeat-containing protein n=1 Tax=Alicyclobacillus macrosporangiidus TaxID=392015 RepID=UPI0026EBC2AC|nr:hypothetical protein [Alicyclobacillus macrosporangiidus]MCL6599128.1 hypothetical protein [Alicyclobacillus macrosporangiidus]